MFNNEFNQKKIKSPPISHQQMSNCIIAANIAIKIFIMKWWTPQYIGDYICVALMGIVTVVVKTTAGTRVCLSFLVF